VKPIKIIGLAALAALMAMAIMSAPSAMAGYTTLCAVDAESECETITHVHEESVGKGVLLSSVKVECNVLFLGDTLEAIGNPLVIHGKFTYTNCGSCEVAEENGPSTIKVLRESHETSSVTGEGLVKVVCSGFISCAYNGVGLKGTGKGPLLSEQENGEVSLQGQTTNKEKGGFLCPETSKLDLTTTPLEAVYVKLPECLEVNTGHYLRPNGTATACEEYHETLQTKPPVAHVYEWYLL
jgi:hypothetical protein